MRLVTVEGLGSAYLIFAVLALVLWALLMWPVMRKFNHGLQVFLVGMATALPAFTLAYCGLSYYALKHEPEPTQLRTALLDAGLPKAKLDTTVEKALRLSTGTYLTVSGVTVVAVERHQYFVGKDEMEDRS